MYPEDWYQTVALGAFLAHLKGASGVEALRIIDAEFRQAMQDYGWYQPEIEGHLVMGWCRWGCVPERALAEKASSFEECSVKWCERRAVHHNEHLGKICHRHYIENRRRLKRGWSTPHYKLEFTGVPDSPPKKNREFWAIVKTALTLKEWAECWLWARDYIKNFPQKSIEKARFAVVNRLSSKGD